MHDPLLTLESKNDVLQFDRNSLALVSFRCKAAPEQEFIDHTPSHPVFIIGYLDSKRQYRWMTSTQAQSVAIQNAQGGADQEFAAKYSQIADLDIQVTCKVKASLEDGFARWSLEVNNPAGLEIVDIQYPFIVCPYFLGGESGSEAILLPHGYGSGHLIERPGETVPSGGAWRYKLAPDGWREWEFCSRTGDCNHYPGMQFSQFLAYYNNRAGLYLACDDTAAHVKRFAALHHDPGIRLGIAHVGDWPSPGVRQLEYSILSTSFVGDWYTAADLYRDWTSKQSWFVPLHQRQDIPSWLLDSPVYLTIRPQGVLDVGPDLPVKEFLPLEEKCIPLLEKIAKKVQTSLAVILMGWEHSGSWVYPDSFPPVGGEEGMVAFIRAIRQHGWHAGSFCNGTRWVIGQGWSGYDGRDFFYRNHAEGSICQEADGSLWRETWDVDWRPSYAACLGTEKTRQTAYDSIRHLAGWGMESLQFLDQNNGSSTFPCFARDHAHPPAPGKWMAESMRQFMADLHQISIELGEPGVVHSAESGLNETCLPLFQETELRTFPPGYGVDNIPLYQYLFHECIILQGMMGNAPEPYHLVIRNAVNCVLGGIPGGVLTGDGTLLDKDTNNWAPWEPRVESSQNTLEMIRVVTALRRGPGKDYLVYGRMLRPAQVDGIQTIEWSFQERNNRIPAVFHSAWQSPGGSLGIVLANWTDSIQPVVVRQANPENDLSNLTLYVFGSETRISSISLSAEGASITLPPISSALLEKRM